MDRRKSCIAAVIVTFNRKETLQKTLEALACQSRPVDSIVVVDNASIDGTAQLISSKFPKVIYLPQPDNVGSAGGFAAGMAYVHQQGYDWAWLFNDDSRPAPDALETSLDAIGELGDSHIGMLKIGHVSINGKIAVLQWNGVRKPVYVSISNTPIKSDLITYDGCLISKSVFDKIGYCNKEFFMGIYEFDFCLRAQAAGFTIYTLPNGKIYDEKKGSSGSTPPWRTYYNTRNHLHLGIKHKSSRIIASWIIRELKNIYGIVRYRDQKLKRIQLKLLATIHALTGCMGKTLDPAKQ